MNVMDKVTEIKDTQNHAYILESPSLFYSVGYKVLMGQEKNGFIKCTKVSHNGKDKLLYDTSRFKTLETLMPGLNFVEMLPLLVQFLDAVIMVKSNGFMQCENVLVSPDHIFVDCDNYNVNLIYLPVNHESDSISYGIFEAELKANLSVILNAYNNRNPYITSLCENLSNVAFNLEEVQEYLKDMQANGYTGQKHRIGFKKKDGMTSGAADSNDMLAGVKKLFSFGKKNK
ncbi:MAG: hypothetical protein K0R05_4515 [Anaerocolumna sp.]|jgi:hypothetical protein|nr:hypothetical protein [Anaerocolumna sp.]